jgi:hypothetical protein
LSSLNATIWLIGEEIKGSTPLENDDKFNNGVSAMLTKKIFLGQSIF